MHLVEPKLRANGFEVLFISTDRPELLYSSLKDQTVTYTLLSDPELRAELPETLWLQDGAFGGRGLAGARHARADSTRASMAHCGELIRGWSSKKLRHTR